MPDWIIHKLRTHILIINPRLERKYAPGGETPNFDSGELLMNEWGVRSLHQGAFWGLVIGLVVGCIRMLLDFIYPAPLCYEEDNRPGILKYIHYLYFSVILSTITLLIVVVISLATEKPKPEQVKQPLAFIVEGCLEIKSVDVVKQKNKNKMKPPKSVVYNSTTRRCCIFHPGPWRHHAFVCILQYWQFSC